MSAAEVKKEEPKTPVAVKSSGPSAGPSPSGSRGGGRGGAGGPIEEAGVDFKEEDTKEVIHTKEEVDVEEDLKE